MTITLQAVFSGLVSGLIYAVLAAGFVLVYRCTGVLNFAEGEIGAFGVALFALLNAGYGVPYWFAFAGSVAASVLVGLVIEMTVVRRLFHSPRLVLLIATIGVGQLLLVARLALPDTAAAEPFPLPFSGLWHPTDSLVVFARDVLVLIVAPISILGLALFMTRTKLGLLVRASASNPDTARLYGISVKRTSTIVWTIAGAFAGLTAIMIAPIQGITPGSIVRAGTEAIGPALLLRALVVSLIARLRSLPMTLVGGLIVGVFEALVLANVDSADRSIVDVYLFLATLVLVLFVHRGRRAEASWSIAARVKPIPERLAGLWYVRHLAAIGYTVLFGILAVLPVFLTQRSQEFLWTDVVIFAMAALPISMLIGWAGQVSLGQFAFVGLGGLSMVVLTQGLDIPVPFALFSLSATLPWGVAIAASTVIGVVASVIVGVPALRVRGLMLAVITFAFGVAATSWLFGQAVFTGSEFSSTTPPTRPPVVGPFDFADRRAFYYFCLGCLFVLTVMVARLRRTGVGRSMIAVRDNEEMAAASTVSSPRVRLIAFALGRYGRLRRLPVRHVAHPSEPDRDVHRGGIAATRVDGDHRRPRVGRRSDPRIALRSWAARGVRRRAAGAAAHERNRSLDPAHVLPGRADADRLRAARRRARLGRTAVAAARASARGDGADAPRVVIERAAPAPAGASLSVRGISVRFGGNQAVDDVSISVQPDELVGLIGTNGAGKSTLLNAICGFVPSTGTIDVLGHDVSGLPAHRRHRAGLGRGFQAAEIYPNLTVRESLMVALEARERSWLLPSMTGLPPSPAAERRKRSDADELVHFLGLGRYADQFIANLSTGTRRIVELASLLAVDAKVLLLDEPTGGLAQRETEAFAPLIVRVRRELGAAMVVIEHDMPLIMGISDRVYCLEAGSVIAEGTPLEVRNNPLVVASYLGTTAPVSQL